MDLKRWRTSLVIGAGAAALCGGVLTSLRAQQPAPGGRGGGRGGAAVNVFTAADANKDGFVTRDELRSTFANWVAQADSGKSGSVTQDQLASALNAAFPQPQAPAGGGRGAQ